MSKLGEITLVTDAPGLVRDLRAEVGNLLEQMHQMKGMFSDADGAIQSAMSDAESTCARATAYLERVRKA